MIIQIKMEQAKMTTNLKNFEMNFETTRIDLSSPILEPHSNNNMQEGLSYEAPNETPELELEMP